MRIVTDKQRTPEWYAARKGCTTASEIHKICMGKDTKGYQNYLLQQVLDMEGVPNFDDSDDKPWFKRGRALEDDALGWYQYSTSTQVTLTGFCVHDEYDWVGFSPDALVGDNGGVEAKFRHTLTTFRQHTTKVQKAVMDQIQTALWISGRAWWDYVNFWQDLEAEQEKGHVLRIYPDAERIAYLEERCLAFRAAALELYHYRKHQHGNAA